MSTAPPPSLSSSSAAMDSSSTASFAAVSDAAEHADDLSEGLVLFLSVCLLLGCMGRLLVKRFPRVPLPFTVLLLFVGALMGAIATYGGARANTFQDALISFSNMSPHLALYIFLPVLIFDSAFNVHYHLFAHSLPAALTLAFPGALVALLFTAIFSKYVFDYGWGWAEALMLGSILCTTDPVAVVGLLRELGSSQSLATLIEAESLLNDGAAFVIFLITEHALNGGDTSTNAIVSQLFQYSLGGPAFGLLCGLVTVWVMKQIYADAEVEISITIAVTYLVFWIADSPLGVSAVLAIVVLGVYMAKHRYAVSPSVQTPLQSVWQLLIFAVNIYIFVLSGLVCADKLIGTRKNIRGIDVVWLIILYVMLHVVRYLSLLAFVPVFRRTGVKMGWREIVMVSFSGMRGGVSLILALITYLEPTYDQVFRDRLMFQVAGIVLLTLIINGISSRFVLQALGLNKGTPESRMVLSSALTHMRQQTAAAIRQMKTDPKFKAVDWPQLRPFLPQQLINEMQHEQGKVDQESTSNDRRRGDGGDGGESARDFFPASHPIHRMLQNEGPGDLTLASMPTMQYREMIGDVRLKLAKADKENVSEPVCQSPRQDAEYTRPSPRTAAMIEMEPVNADTPPLFARGATTAAYDSEPTPHPTPSSTVATAAPPLQVTHRQQSVLLSMFDEPTDEELAQQPMSPPANPPAPPFPPAPVGTEQQSSTEADYVKNVFPRFSPLKKFPSLPVPPPVSSKFRRRLLQHRRYAIQNASSMYLNDTSAIKHKINLHRELSIRFLTAMQADYHRQFSAGLITTNTLRILMAASGAAMDEGSLGAHWSFIHSRLRAPWWLWLLFESWFTSDSVWWILRPLRRWIRMMMFEHLKVSVELATAYLSAKQRMEYVLQAFPEFDEIDREVVEHVRLQAGYYQKKALAAWIDVCEGYFEAHAAVATRHAAVLLLHFQQSEITSLQGTGMLESREYELIADLILKKLIHLERKGIHVPLTPSIQLLMSTSPFCVLPQTQQRRLKQMLHEKGSRRWLRAQEMIYQRDEPCPALLIVVRGTVRVMYEYSELDDDNESTEPLSTADWRQHKVQKEDIRWHGFTAQRTTSNTDNDTENANTNARQWRFYDSMPRGSIIGAYEMLTGHTTITSCSSATMVEAYYLDQECLSLLLHEDEVALVVIRSAAVAVMKQQWKDWKLSESTGLREYQLTPLMERANIHRIERSEQTVDLHVTDVVLILKGRAQGQNVKRRIKVQRQPTSLDQRRQSFPGRQQPSERVLTRQSSEDAIRLQSINVIPPSAVSSTPLRPLDIPSNNDRVEIPILSSPFKSPGRPIYLAPCLLSSRSGLLTVSPGSIVVQWSLRDQEIAALFPPSPRADIYEYAAQLGLTMQLGVSAPKPQRPEVDSDADNGSDDVAGAHTMAPGAVASHGKPQAYHPSATVNALSSPMSVMHAHTIGSYLGIPATLTHSMHSGRVPNEKVSQNSGVVVSVSGGNRLARDSSNPSLRTSATMSSLSPEQSPPPVAVQPPPLLRAPSTPHHYRNQSSLGSAAILIPVLAPHTEAADDADRFIEVDEDEYDSDAESNERHEEDAAYARELARMAEEAENEYKNSHTV